VARILSRPPPKRGKKEKTDATAAAFVQSGRGARKGGKDRKSCLLPVPVVGPTPKKLLSTVTDTASALGEKDPWGERGKRVGELYTPLPEREKRGKVCPDRSTFMIKKEREARHARLSFATGGRRKRGKVVCSRSRCPSIRHVRRKKGEKQSNF